MSPNKVLKVSFIINMIQMSLMLIGLIYIVLALDEAVGTFFIIAIVSTLLNGMITLGSYFFILKHKKQNIIDTLTNLENLNRILREQRHDYLNHIQVIYGLMQLEEYEEAKKYIQPVYKDILKVSKALKTYHPAINALLQAKMQMAEKQHIDLYLEIKTDLKHLTLEPWELCKVLSNIIDNALQALSAFKKERKVYIDFMENKTAYCFKITNNGPLIPKEVLENIFEEGFTTKEEGQGIGLAIAKRIVKNAGGELWATSCNDETVFFIELPKRSDN